MPPRYWSFRIQDMLASAELIVQYTNGATLESFRNTSMLRDAVIRNLEIIGEAACHVPDEIADRYQEIEWPKIRGMRHHLIHEYFGASLDIIWSAARNDVPTLIPKLRRILDDQR